VTAPEPDLLAGWCITVQRTIPRPPEDIFALLTDVERVAGLGPEHVKARWLTELREAGARFQGMNRVGDFEWTVPCTVTAFVPPRLFSWTVGDPLEPSSTWTYTLEATRRATDGVTGGATTITHTFEHGPGYSHIRNAVESDPASAARIIDARTGELRHNMRSTLQQVEVQLTGPDKT
jgi:uncharacterized protein YndB with AHSA1/START domain